ncbi:MAG: sulfite exporter TauE/SafE family protein [Polaromonas sp.]|nr:sulfite exporter TauE/SafE family protein [Gemmatimonadaceae bacterium]
MLLIVASAAAAVVGGTVTPGGVSTLWTVFITGITTGGLSCMAVQGGLLAGCLKPAESGGSSLGPKSTISSFLVAKIAAYTALGLLLGLFGSVVQLSVTTRGAMQLAIGVFMLLTGWNMVRPHPWLRFVALEPPPAVRRLIRRVSKSHENAATPLFLGALTVLIPCGITQAMMALAITTGNPLAGAAVMLVFTLATSPMFFTLSYAATSIGRFAEQQFNKVVGILILILGYVAIQTGAILIGHPLPVRPLFTNLTPATAVAKGVTGTDGVQRSSITVRVDGYSPNRVSFRAGEPARLVMGTKSITGCTRALNIPKLNIQKSLKVTGLTTVAIPPQKAGTTLEWVCGMGMFTGTMSFK